MKSDRVISLHAVDLAIIAIYFVAVLAIGFYLKRFAKSGEDFFLAGREMTAWVAGSAFFPPISVRSNCSAGRDQAINTASWPRIGIGWARFRP